MTAINIVEVLKDRGHGDLAAIRHFDCEVSFDDLFAAVDEICCSLKSQPFFAEHAIPRLGVQLPNGVAYIVVALAVLQSGACFVPIPDEYTTAEQEDLISKTALHGVVSFVSESSSPNSPIDLPFELGTIEVSSISTPEPTFPENEFNSLNPAFIRFSSGTTSKSKGVVISHESLLERISAANKGLEVEPGTKVLWTLPMAHHFAVSIVLYLYFRATTVIETTHCPDEIYLAAERSGANVLYGSPFHFAQLAQCSIAGPLPSLNLAIATASAVCEDVAKAFFERFQLPITQALGIIEVGLPVLNRKRAADLPTALGVVLPDYEWKIKPSVENESSGELLLKGPGMLDAYLTPWRTRKDITEDGWFSSGDIVEVVDEENTLMMRGRCKNVINVGGMKVFPEEIEAVLNRHPSVLRSKVYAGSHPTLGSYPCVDFVGVGENNLAPKELRAHCEQSLAKYKIPLQFRQMEEIDLTANGKIRRHSAR